MNSPRLVTKKRLINAALISKPVVVLYSRKKNYKYSMYSLTLVNKSNTVNSYDPLNTSLYNPNPQITYSNYFSTISYYKYLFKFDWFYIFKYFNHFLLVLNTKLNLVYIKIFYLLTSQFVTTKKFSNSTQTQIRATKQSFYI